MLYDFKAKSLPLVAFPSSIQHSQEDIGTVHDRFQPFQTAPCAAAEATSETAGDYEGAWETQWCLFQSHVALRDP